MHITNCRKAFTLAEILVVLGIIGIVAALTIPSVIQKYKEKELVARYKRVYSILGEAYIYVMSEYGPANTWANGAHDTYYYFKKYLKIIADCPPNSNAKARKICTGSNNSYLQDYITLTGQKFSDAGAYKYASVRLITGEVIIFNSGSGTGVYFYIDLNGNNKPNQLGVDFHMLSFTDPTYTKITPGATWELGEYHTKRNTHYTRCDKSNNSAWYAGSSCGIWILKHNNMDYLHLNTQEIKQKW